MSARDRILARLGTTAAFPAPDVANWYAAHRPENTLSERISQFRTCITAAHAEVHLVQDDWPKRLYELMTEKKIDQLLLAPDTAHGQHAKSELRSSGIVCNAYADPIEDWKPRLFNESPAALTLARGAIAETGTLILWPDPDEPRTMSLVPPVHFVLLEADTIHSTFHAVMQAEGWSRGLPTNALLISGPSKTADIQQTLAYGAHGPKELIVLLKGVPQ